MGVFYTTIKNLSGLGLGEAASAAKSKIIHQRILKRICAYIDNKTSFRVKKTKKKKILMN